MVRLPSVAGKDHWVPVRGIHYLGDPDRPPSDLPMGTSTKPTGVADPGSRAPEPRGWTARSLLLPEEHRDPDEDEPDTGQQETATDGPLADRGHQEADPCDDETESHQQPAEESQDLAKEIHAHGWMGGVNGGGSVGRRRGLSVRRRGWRRSLRWSLRRSRGLGRRICARRSIAAHDGRYEGDEVYNDGLGPGRRVCGRARSPTIARRNRSRPTPVIAARRRSTDRTPTGEDTCVDSSRRGDGAAHTREVGGAGRIRRIPVEDTGRIRIEEGAARCTPAWAYGWRRRE